MNREDLKITKISEEEYERLKDSDEGEAMEVSIDSLKAEQEKLKESASLLDEAKKAFSAYWFLLSLFIGQNLCLGVVKSTQHGLKENPSDLWYYVPYQ